MIYVFAAFFAAAHSLAFRKLSTEYFGAQVVGIFFL